MAVILGSCLGEAGTMCGVKRMRAGCFILNMFSLLMPDGCLLMSLPLTGHNWCGPGGQETLLRAMRASVAAFPPVTTVGSVVL